MSYFFYTYNNEAITSFVISSYLKEVKSCDIGRLVIIIPILLNDKLVYALKRNTDITLPKFFKIVTGERLKYNSFYLSVLPIIINSLKILYETKVITHSKEVITYNENNNLLNKTLNLCERQKQINEILPMVISLTEKYTTTRLYEIFRIKL